MSSFESTPEEAQGIVYDLLQTNVQASLHPTFSKDEVVVVWFCYILGGWKSLITTTLPYGMYYEVTYNKDKDEVYVDIYKKVDQAVITSQ